MYSWREPTNIALSCLNFMVDVFEILCTFVEIFLSFDFCARHEIEGCVISENTAVDSSLCGYYLTIA